jgi:hypothetical protein
MDASGIDWRGSDPVVGLGVEVCQVDGEPATFDATNCLKPSQKYWVLFKARDGEGWIGSNLGISSIDLSDGDSFGLRYELMGALPTIMGNCPAATPAPPTPKPTPKPTAPPTQRPTATPSRTSTPGTPAAGVTDVPSAPPTSPAASPTDGGLAVASGSPGSSPTPEPAIASAAPSAPAVGVPEPSTGGDPPLGLVLVAVTGLAFAALGVVHIRRSS